MKKRSDCRLMRGTKNSKKMRGKKFHLTPNLAFCGRHRRKSKQRKMSDNFGRSRQESRKKDFKNTGSTDDSRRRREETSVRIRKNKREESLAKKRNFGQNTGAARARHHDASVAQKVLHTFLLNILFYSFLFSKTFPLLCGFTKILITLFPA